MLLGLAGPGMASAQNVTLNGSIGSRAALLVIDGQPRTVAVGSTVQGVRLLALDDVGAEVEIDGRRLRLRIGASPVTVGGADAGGPAGGGREIVLTAAEGGHFLTTGAINGRSVQFMVDTGATSVAIGQGDADRIGLRYADGQRVMTQTANGPVPAHLITLSSVRVGDVVVANVQAVVLPAAMPHVLLGNSFLSRFQMRRENDVMRLEKRN